MKQLFTRAYWTFVSWDTWLTSWVCSFCLLWRYTNWRPSASRLSRGWGTMSLPHLGVKLALSALAHQFTSSSSSCLPHWRRRALEVWNWWRCACENVSGASLASEREREREIKRKRVHFGVEGMTDRSGKSAFSWTLNCKMEDPVQNNGRDQSAMVRGFSWMPRCQPGPAERERKGKRGREWQKETQTHVRCVSLSVWGREVREVESRRSWCRVQGRKERAG